MTIASARLKKHAVQTASVDDVAWDRLFESAESVDALPLVVIRSSSLAPAEAVVPWDKMLCPYELNSVRSMISYVAQNQNLPEPNVEAMVCAKFNARQLQEVRRDDFRNAISFLIDLKIGEIRD